MLLSSWTSVSISGTTSEETERSRARFISDHYGPLPSRRRGSLPAGVILLRRLRHRPPKDGRPVEGKRSFGLFHPAKSGCESGGFAFKLSGL